MPTPLGGAAGDIGVVYALAAGTTWERFMPDRPELSSLDSLDRYDCVLIQVAAGGGTKWVLNVQELLLTREWLDDDRGA